MAKFKKGDLVCFEIEGQTISGTILVVDELGAGEWYGKQPSYDILLRTRLYFLKHVPESELRPVAE